MQNLPVDLSKPFYEPDPSWGSQTNFIVVVEVYVTTCAVHSATASRTPAWGVGLICQFTVHDSLENCWLSLLMLLSIKIIPEKCGCSGTTTLFSQPYTRQRSTVDVCYGQNLVCLPQPTLLDGLVLPVFTWFYLRHKTRICDLNVWNHHIKSHIPVESLRQMPRMPFDSQQHQGWLRL